MANWKDKVIVVTGGNAGLGASITRAFFAKGATVVSISRSPGEKDSERRVSVAADVTTEAEVQRAVAQISERFGRIDVWINNVGKSTRVALDQATMDAYRDLMEVNFFSSVQCSMAALPWLEKTSGSLVQIGSLASRTGWKYVAPYVTSKHALAGFAHQLRVEGPGNVHNLLVCPGPIRRTDESSDRYDAANSGMDAAAQQPGAGAKISAIDPDVLAAKIVTACERRKPELVVPGKTRILFALLSLFPSLGDWVLRRFGTAK